MLDAKSIGIYNNCKHHLKFNPTYNKHKTLLRIWVPKSRDTTKLMFNESYGITDCTNVLAQQIFELTKIVIRLIDYHLLVLIFLFESN